METTKFEDFRRSCLICLALLQSLKKTKWPLLAPDVLRVPASISVFVLGEEIIFLPRAALLCHFLFILMSFLGLIMLSYSLNY